MGILPLVLLFLGMCHARMSVMYAHDKTSDHVVEQCLAEMYPKARRIEIQESDEACIIFCVLKKFGIMNANGIFKLEAYRNRLIHVDVRGSIGHDYGQSCIESAESAAHKQDVCKKAKFFNDCTHLYRILLRK